jgi:hypothetical protein
MSLFYRRDEVRGRADETALEPLEQVAGALNAWLIAMAIGLAVLDFTVLVAKCMPPLPTILVATVTDHSGQAVTQTLSKRPASQFTCDR